MAHCSNQENRYFLEAGFVKQGACHGASSAKMRSTGFESTGRLWNEWICGWEEDSRCRFLQLQQGVWHHLSQYSYIQVRMLWCGWPDNRLVLKYNKSGWMVRVWVNVSSSTWRLVSCGALQESVLLNSFVCVLEEVEYVLLNAFHPKLKSCSQCGWGQSCYPEGPGGRSQQEPHGN